jgi:cysteinyl-tRNA synthetase
MRAPPFKNDFKQKIKNYIIIVIMKKFRIYNIPLISAIIIFSIIFLCPGCLISNTKFDSSTRFIYVLQNAGFKELNNVEFNIAVVDLDESKLSQNDLKNLHNMDKVVIAYLSIGEAENYRSYWKDDWETGSPAFIDDENPDWEGNYKVRYWYEEWQQIIFSRLNYIISLGYDGVYLDVVDSFEYYKNKGIDFAEEKMVELVINISKEAKKSNKNFLIVPQNAERLLAHENYLSAIDGIGREDLWYIDNNLQPEAELETALLHLNKAIDSGKFVLVVSYPTEKDKKCNFIKMAKEHNFIPYVGRRELDTIETTDCD